MLTSRREEEKEEMARTPSKKTWARALGGRSGTGQSIIPRSRRGRHSLPERRSLFMFLFIKRYSDDKLDTPLKG